MKTHVLSVYDRVTKQYDKLFTTRSTERIQEEFDVICADPKAAYSRNPTEYEVHELGIFNDSPHHDPEIKPLWYAAPKILAQGKAPTMEAQNANT